MKIEKKIKTIASDVLLNEASAIKKVSSYLNDDFEACVRKIFNTKGRVILTGIGKSAIIANKIVSTLNSTGTPSLFMHAADAIHGDLGMIQKEDIVICLSKSGNTPEIKVLVPLIKRTGVPLVALVSNTESYLAAESDFVINGTIDEEACPNNLAPTTSTTVHLALGDALAVCLLSLREFSSADFAKYHPGGSLGKRLYLKVDDIILHNEKPTVKTDTNLRDVIMEISSKRLGVTVVLDGEENLVGIITDGDLRRMLESNDQWKDMKAEDIMSKSPKSLQLGEYAVTALKVMQDNSITQILIMDGKKFAGIVHLHDLLKEGIV